MKLQKDLREFVESLISERAEFVVIGGHAVAYHGHPRYTGDIDFLVRPTVGNAARVLEALRLFGFGDLGLTADDFIRPENVVQLGRPPNRIDLLTTISGVNFDRVWSGRVIATLDGLPVAFIGWDELIANKRASGRAKDLADVAALTAVGAARGGGG